MFGKLLSKVGSLSPDTASSVVRAIAGEAASFTGDLIGATVEVKISSMIRPLLEDVRRDILEHVTGDPPPSWAARISARYPSMSTEQIAILWADVVASIAETPAAPAEEAAA